MAIAGARAAFAALAGIEHELLLFAAVGFAIGAIDELVIDALWLWLALSGRGRSRRMAGPAVAAPLRGTIAVLVPAWREANVIGAMLGHCLRVWPQRELRIYAGCYHNDPATHRAMLAAAGDARLRIVVHPIDGPPPRPIA